MPEFDLVAPVYDSTRRPPSEEELAAVVEALQGIRSVLEGGVGTGRYARPLTDRGFELTGADISYEMIRRAREKGLSRLLLADLHRLPFRDASFDGSLIVHVLQLIPDPLPVLEELARVARTRVVALLPDHRQGGLAMRGRFRRRYVEIASELGYSVPPRERYWQNAEKLLELLPPDHLRTVQEEITPDPDRERRWREARTFGGFITVPPEVHEKIIARMREELPPEERGPRPRSRSLRIAQWGSGALREHLGEVRARGGDAAFPVARTSEDPASPAPSSD